MRDAKRVFFLVTAVVSALAVVYVAYVHLLASRRAKVDDVKDFREGFGSRDALPEGWNVHAKGALTAKVVNGVFRVEGNGKAGDEILVDLPPRRFEDSVVSLAFATPAQAGVELFVGVAQLGEPPRALTTGWVSGPEPLLHFGGDTSGPYREMRATEDVKLSGFGGDAGTAITDGAPSHTIALQFTPMFGHAAALVDGLPVTSAHSGWLQATPARLVFGVRLRKDVPDLAVAIESLALRTLDWTLASFEDPFSGEFVDPVRYGVHFPDPDLGVLDMRMAKGGGLLMHSRSTALVAHHVPLFMLRTTPFPLRTCRITADVTIEKLEEAALFFGLMGASAWTPANRVFDVGVVHRNGKPAEIFAGGAWTTTGGLSFDPGGNVELPKRIVIEIRYDATTSKGATFVDGRPLGEHVVDLKALDFTAIRIGADGYSAASVADVKVHKLAVEQR